MNVLALDELGLFHNSMLLRAQHELLRKCCAGARFDADRDGWRWFNLWLGQMKSRVSVKNDRKLLNYLMWAL